MDNPESRAKAKPNRPRPIAVLLLLYVPLTAMYAASMVHTLRGRPLEDIVRYSLISGAPLMVIWLGVIVADLFRKKWAEAALTFFVSLFTYAVVGFGFYSFGVSIKDLVLWLATSKNIIAWLLFVFSIPSVAALLFYFRLRWRSTYGLTEASVGLLIAFFRLHGQDVSAVIANPETLLAMLTASVYLMVRGLDNMHQGLVKDPKDPLAVRIANEFSGLRQSMAELQKRVAANGGRINSDSNIETRRIGHDESEPGSDGGADSLSEDTDEQSSTPRKSGNH